MLLALLCFGAAQSEHIPSRRLPAPPLRTVAAMSDTVRRLLETISRLQASLQAQADRLPAEAAATRDKRRRLAAADKGARAHAAAALRVRACYT